MMLDEVWFLRAARVSGEAHKSVGDETMAVCVGDWLRLVEMAERAADVRSIVWAAADAVNLPASVPSDGLGM